MERVSDCHCSILHGVCQTGRMQHADKDLIWSRNGNYEDVGCYCELSGSESAVWGKAFSSENGATHYFGAQ